MAVSATFDDVLARSNLTGRQFLIYAGQRLHPGRVLYNSVYAIGWSDLDPQRFTTAWRTLLHRCDALRTLFHEHEGVPQQRVLPTIRFDPECIDLRGSDTTARHWIEARLLAPLQLHERVFDTALLRTHDNEYVWFLHIHHIVVDGAAVQLLIRRLTELYWDPSSVPERFPSFAEHAARACASRVSEKYAAARDYWLEYLHSVPEIPHFYGVDGLRNTGQERVILSLDPSVSAAIRHLGKALSTAAMSEHAVIANLFNAVFAAYLSRVGATQQVSVGVTFHNRSTEQDRDTVGLFMEVCPIGLRVSAADSLTTLLRQVASCTSQALKHRSYSVGHSARAPSFSGLFNYMRSLSRPKGKLDVRRVHPGHGSNAISLSVEPREDTFDLWFDVAADIAATSTAADVAGHLHTLLEAAVRQPEAPLSRLPLLSPAQSSQVVSLGTGPALRVATSGSCLRAFELAVSSAPAAQALSFGAETTLTYTQLNARANHLALAIRALGGRRGRRVGICLERSPEMVIAVLGVLKSGAAYVPLDPTYPAGRLRAMLTDAAPAVLITTERIAATLPPNVARPLFIEHHAGELYEPARPDWDVSPDDIAYVIYTSGSTGAPKGVLVTHGNVTNHLAWRHSFFPLTPADRCLQTASLSFDDSVWEILEPLSAGATLVVTRPRFEYDSTYLVQLMLNQRVTVACFVPSLLRTLIELAQIADCHSLRRLTTGGEGLSIPLQQRVRERLPDTAFYNGYGTTEATIASVYWRCEITAGQTVVPIGRPIANTEVYILDAHLQLVPPGVLGEICIGGAGVSRGYLDRPQLTAERFVPDPLKTDAGARLYRTGDLGRLRPDGIFEFAGRVDDQVKIRGIRVELGDIEAALLDHPQVHSAAVLCSDTPSGKQLTAFVVAKGAVPIAVGELRTFVRDRIPAPLVPNRFAFLDAIPFTPSGKLDRRALPEATVAEEGSSYLAPSTELETRLVRQWEEVLQARPIGIRDDFFELGGHSLSAVQLAASLEKAMGRSLSPGLLFESPTIEALASRLTTPTTATGRTVISLCEGGDCTPLFLIHHISGDVTAYRDLAPYLGRGRKVYGVRAPELENNQKPLDSIVAMAQRYTSEIRLIQPYGPYLLGGHSAGAHIAYEIARQLREGGERVALLAILEADARRPGARRGVFDTIRYQLDLVGRLPLRQRPVYLWRKVMRRPLARGAGAAGSAPRLAGNAVWAAMERAVKAYNPQPYAGEVTLFRATDRSGTGTYSRTLGWERLAGGRIRVIDVPGSHSTVLRPGSEPPMAAKLRACLEEVTARETAGKL